MRCVSFQLYVHIPAYTFQKCTEYTYSTTTERFNAITSVRVLKFIFETLYNQGFLHDLLGSRKVEINLEYNGQKCGSACTIQALGDLLNFKVKFHY